MILPGVPVQTTVESTLRLKVADASRAGFTIQASTDGGRVIAGVTDGFSKRLGELTEGFSFAFLIRRNGTVSHLIDLEQTREAVREIHRILFAEYPDDVGLPAPRAELQESLRRWLESDILFAQGCLQEVEALFACLQFEFTSLEPLWDTLPISDPDLPAVRAMRTANLELVAFDDSSPTVRMKLRIFDEYSGVPAVDAWLASRGRRPGGDYVGAPERMSRLILDSTALSVVERRSGWPIEVDTTLVVRGDVDPSESRMRFTKVETPPEG
jgi:hypothetical protein